MTDLPLARLAALRLPDDAHEVIGLADPDPSSLEEAASDDLVAVAAAFARMMVPYVLPRSGTEAQESPDSLRASLGDEMYLDLGIRVAEYFFVFVFVLLGKGAYRDIRPMVFLEADIPDFVPAPRSGLATVAFAGLSALKNMGLELLLSEKSYPFGLIPVTTQSS